MVHETDTRVAKKARQKSLMAAIIEEDYHQNQITWRERGKGLPAILKEEE